MATGNGSNSGVAWRDLEDVLANAQALLSEHGVDERLTAAGFDPGEAAMTAQGLVSGVRLFEGDADAIGAASACFLMGVAVGMQAAAEEGRHGGT